ncbi:MAG: hypothetical protein ACLU6V_00515 [Lancefieldella rimae]
MRLFIYLPRVKKHGEVRRDGVRAAQTYGIDVRVHSCDLAVPDAAIGLYESTRADSLVVDRLVNSAGFGDQGAFIDADWKRQADMIQ